MQNSVKKMLARMFADKKRQKKIVAVICALSVLVTTGVFSELMQPVITMTPDPICGAAAHTHSADCYKTELVCDLAEGEEHTHGEGCSENVLACGLSEHVHVESCYPEKIEEPMVQVLSDDGEIIEVPEVTEAPVTAEEPAVISEETEPTEQPEVTAEPVTAEEPVVTEEPTAAPEVTEEPVVTEEPTAAPEVTEEPTATEEPAATAEPTAPAVSVSAANANIAVGQTAIWNFTAAGAAEASYIITDAEGNEVATGSLTAESTQVEWLADREGAFTLTVLASNEIGKNSANATITVEAVTELTAAVHAGARSVFAGETASFSFAYAGGAEPVSVKIVIENNGAILADIPEFASSVTVDVPAHEEVTSVKATITVTDSLGAVATADCEIPAAVRKVENETVWTKSVETELGDDWRENLIAVAKTQLGYQESDVNFVIDEEGKQHGYTRYGHWYGSSYAEWCAMFVSFNLNYAEIPEKYFPREANCERWIAELKYRDLYEDAKDYEPETGDLIFFDWEEDGESDHVGIVLSVTDQKIETIEGNASAAVRVREYNRKDDAGILFGYGLMTEAFENYIADELELDLETGVNAQALVVADADVLPAPGETDEPAEQIAAGAIVNVLAAEQDLAEIWYEIEGEGLTGFVPAEALELNYIEPETLVPVVSAYETLSAEVAAYNAPAEPAEDTEEYYAAREAAKAELLAKIETAYAEGRLSDEEYSELYLQLTGELPAVEEEVVETEPEAEPDPVTVSMEIVEIDEENSNLVMTAVLTGINAEDYNWQWQVAPSEEGPWTDIEGATELTYTAALTDETFNSFYRIYGDCAVVHDETLAAVEEAPAEEPKFAELADHVSQMMQSEGFTTMSRTETEEDVVSAAVSASGVEEQPTVLVSEGEDCTVTVSYLSDANIPENAVLSVRELLPGTEEYDEYYATMLTALNPVEETAAEEEVVAAEHHEDGEGAQHEHPAPKPERVEPSFIRFFDICFIVDGEEIEPNDFVSVSIDFVNAPAMAENEEIQIHHFDHSKAAPERMESHFRGERVEFKSDRFSVYSVMTAASDDEVMAAAVEVNTDTLYWANTSKVKYFYWRFDRTDITGNATGTTGNDFTSVNSYSNHVKVSYTNGNTSSAMGVPYNIYQNRTTGVTTCDSNTANSATSAVNCSTVLGKYASTNNSSTTTSDTVKVNVKTDIGYVITGYVIACETYSGNGTHIGEVCSTVSGYNLDVALDTSGLYFSDFDITITPATFGHSSNGGDTNNYVLLLQIAEVNVALKVTKAADKESVGAGDTVTYTVNATTTNALTKVQFTDEFFKSIVSGTLKVSITSDGTNYTYLTESNSNFSSYSDTPSKYYLDETNGIIYINGMWTSTYTIRIEYDYETLESQKNTTITNTVVATGTKTATTDTVQDLGVAQVKVIVNELSLGSIRVYKTFSGLLTDEVLGTSSKSGVLAGYEITVTNSSGGVVKTLKTSDGTLHFYSSDTSSEPITYTYYGDVTSLSPGTYTVTETGYTVDGYRCSTTYAIAVDANRDDDYEDDGETSSGSGATATGAVVANETTFVRFTNSYGNRQHLVKVVKTWKSTESDDGLPITLSGTKGDTTYTGTATLNAANKWEYVFGLTESDWPSDANEYTWTATETLPSGYYQVGVPVVVEDSTHTESRTVYEYDDQGKVTGSHTETKEYSCDIVTLTNAKYASLTLAKVNESGTELTGASFQLHKLAEKGDTDYDQTFGTGGVKTLSLGSVTEQLKEGYYRLTEKTAPAGYYMLASSIYFRVDADGNVYLTDSNGDDLSSTTSLGWALNNGILTITNHTGSELPSTGGAGTLPYTIGGLLLMAASLLCGFGQRRKRERGAVQ